MFDRIKYHIYIYGKKCFGCYWWYIQNTENVLFSFQYIIMDGMPEKKTHLKWKKIKNRIIKIKKAIFIKKIEKKGAYGETAI